MSEERDVLLHAPVGVVPDGKAVFHQISSSISVMRLDLNAAAGAASVSGLSANARASMLLFLNFPAEQEGSYRTPFDPRRGG